MDRQKAIEQLKLRLEEGTNVPSYDSPAFKEWHERTEVTLRTIYGEGHQTWDRFRHTHFAPMAIRATAEDYRQALAAGMQSASALLKAAIFELETLADAGDVATGAATDPELWEHVAHLVDEEQWAQVASQTGIFVESHIRAWAGLTEKDHGVDLMGKVFSEKGGIFPLGRTDSEQQGWHLFARGFVMALRNVDTHRIQKRDDAKRYALGVLGAGSLLLTQLRHEHGNRFHT